MDMPKKQLVAEALINLQRRLIEHIAHAQP
jgi:hypothetical protein